MSAENTKDRKNEEIRALFVLGLLAVLASVRTQNPELTATFGQVTIPLIPVIDIMLVLWSFYALFMVIGFSEDMFGKMVAKSFRYYAKVFLAINFVMLILVSFVYSLAIYQNRILWILGLIAIAVLCYFYDKFRKMKKNAVSLRSNLTKEDVASFALSLEFIACALFIFFYSSEPFIPFFFAVGVFCMLLLFYLNREKE